MESNNFVFLFIWVCASGSVLDNDIGRLRFVHLVWRHGDRSPASGTFPTDTQNPESSWPQGWGELTQLGIQQHFALGRFFRERYKGFISSRYVQREVRVQSTAYNRTIMSALANMAGWFPPSGAQLWNVSIPWQPIPVHIWLQESGPCPAKEKLSKKAPKSERAVKFWRENADFLEFLGRMTGMDKEPGGLNLVKVWDTLLCEKMHPKEHPWPSWVNDSIFERLTHLYYMQCMFSNNNNSIELQRLRGGALLGEILDRMERVESSQQNQPSKLIVYSAHDSTVLPLLSILGVTVYGQPPYTATVILELRQQKNGDYFVELLYKNTSAAPVRLPIGECGVRCRLEDFARRSRPRIPLDYRKECGLSPQLWLLSGEHLMMLIALLSALCLAFLVGLIYVAVRLAIVSRNPRIIVTAAA